MPSSISDSNQSKKRFISINNGKDQTGKNDLITITIYAFLIVIVIFLESICTLLKGIRKGIFKKEILTKTSGLGFDIDIIMK